ncbi:MAG: hypothetical protein ACYC7E_16215 [Armatimonadota bacterium]
MQLTAAAALDCDRLSAAAARDRHAVGVIGLVEPGGGPLLGTERPNVVIEGAFSATR